MMNCTWHMQLSCLSKCDFHFKKLAAIIHSVICFVDLAVRKKKRMKKEEKKKAELPFT